MTVKRAETSLLTRAFEALASLRLAVVLMVSLGAACVWATFYESRHGTAAAQREFYGTAWFAALLALLGVSVLFSMLHRYPWTKHHVGFVTAHVGILLLLAGSLVTLHFGLDAQMALYEGETTDRVSLSERTLHVALPGHTAHGTFTATSEDPGTERRLPIGGSAATLVVEAWAAHVEVTEDLVEGSEPSPALHFSMGGGHAQVDGWLIAADPGRSHLDFGPVLLGLHAVASAREALAPVHEGEYENQIAFSATRDGGLYYRLTAKKGRGSSGRVEVGKPIPTPWMEMALTVDHFLPRAALRRNVAPAPASGKEERRTPAVRVRLDGPSGRSASEWVAWSETRAIAFDGGEATVSFRPRETAVPFQVTLLSFDSEKYPGSNMPATYESRVRVEDPERGGSEHLISMNHPLHYRGYTLFQSSFVEGQPMMSILSVSRAPGLPVVYLGTTLLTLGVIWMFYVKPYLARRQAAAALRARSGAARVLATTGEPAPTRA